MEWVWWVAPLVIVVGVVLMLAGVGHLAAGRPGKSGTRLVVGVPVTLLGLAAGLLGFNTQTYSRLTYESPVAEVSVQALDPSENVYAVTVQRLDSTNIRETCNLQGDEWVLSGRVQKWKPWANVIGLNATYTLDQISNKYFTAVRSNGKTITACDINGPKPIIAQYVPDWVMKWLVDQAYAEDRRFGSANYMPLADKAKYKIVITQAGFNAMPDNDIAKAANDARS
jgi:hypothetical protein